MRIAYKYNEMYCQILSDDFFVYKINKRWLPFPEWFRKFHSAQCFIHTFTRKGSSRRLNIYDCRGISTTVIPPAPLYFDIQTRYPYDCKSFRSRRSMDWFCLQSVSNTIRFHYLKINVLKLRNKLFPFIIVHFHLSLWTKKYTVL